MKDAILKRLEEIVGGDNLITETRLLSRHSVDGIAPDAVVVPGSVQEMAHVVRAVAEDNLATVVWGGGTKIGIGHRPERMDIVLSTLRLDKVIDMDTANLTVTAQAGVRFADLQSALRGEENRCYLPVSSNGQKEHEVCSEREHMGCFVPLDPPFGDTATLGGIVAANSSGPRRLLYGTVRDMLLGVRYVNPEGKVIGMGGKTVKNVSGYDVSKLMIGSMGTLGVLCEMTFRLLPLPERSATTVIAFASMDKAFSLVQSILASKLTPAAVELFDTQSAISSSVLLQDIAENARYFVAVLAEGATEEVERIRSDTISMGTEAGSTAQLDLENEAHLSFWNSYGAITNRAADDLSPSLVLRLSSPISRLKDLLTKAIGEARELGFDTGVLAHAGSGVGRVVVRDRPQKDGVLKWIGRLLESCISIGGNFVVERAEYEWKTELPIWGVARPEQDIIRRIKEQVDPKRIFSPGRYIGGI